MRMIAGATLILSACATAAAQEEEPVPLHGSTPGYACDASKAQSLAGQPATADLATRAIRLAGARTVRWIRPGDAVTMDFREDRLNIELDERGRVKALRCG